MKTPATIGTEASAPGTGAEIVAYTTLPKRRNTVRAEVLCRLLCGERLTGLEAVFDASTTRLGAVTHALHVDYGWVISTADKAVGTKDGRVAHVSVYFLQPTFITEAMKAGVAGWCREVRAARAALRTKAAEALRRAAEANAAADRCRSAVASAAQGELFHG